jgi:hypothetical protein
MINPVAGPRILDGWMQATVEIMEFKIAIGLLPAENEARSVIGISVKQALLIATLTLYSHSKWQRGYSAAWHPQPLEILGRIRSGDGYSAGRRIPLARPLTRSLSLGERTVRSPTYDIAQNYILGH